FPWDSYGPFDLENIDEAECKAEFRVEKRDLPTLREVLGIPPAFKCPQRTICDGMEGLCMLLKRLAYPSRYSDMITRFGRPTTVFGFVDGTVRPISKPGDMQRIVYHGHKRVHALKFQSVALPNGLIANMFGPVEGRRHDAGMLHDSGLLNDLEAYAYLATGRPCLPPKSLFSGAIPKLPPYSP
ncbi:unnamed protein product, partial [Pocillopora meandrina]